MATAEVLIYRYHNRRFVVRSCIATPETAAVSCVQSSAGLWVPKTFSCTQTERPIRGRLCCRVPVAALLQADSPGRSSIRPEDPQRDRMFARAGFLETSVVHVAAKNVSSLCASDEIHSA